jgi:hypothetical protein
MKNHKDTKDTKFFIMDINELPEEAQNLLIDFIELLKKRYSLAARPEIKSETNLDNQASPLDILKQSGLIGCISGEAELSTNYNLVCFNRKLSSTLTLQKI